MIGAKQMNMNKIAFKLALLLLAICSVGAKAAEQTWVAIDSVTWSNVSLATTAFRVDNLNLGSAGNVLFARNKITLTIPSNSPKFNCNYYPASATSVSISTTAGNVNLGAEFATTSTESKQIDVPLPSYVAYWCLVQGTSTGTLHVDQTRPVRPMFGN